MLFGKMYIYSQIDLIRLCRPDAPVSFSLFFHCNTPTIPIPISHCRSTIRRLWTRPAVRAAICWPRRELGSGDGVAGLVWSGFLLVGWVDEVAEEEEEAPRVLGTLRAQSITVAVDFTLRTAQVSYLW